MKTLKVMSALLSYPSAELAAAAGEMRLALTRESLLPRDLCDGIELLIADLETGDLIDIQERYNLLFERTRSLSLYLFEHVHGESRDRGQAMVDLKRLYEERGFQATAKELPDYIPMFLEFAATLPAAEAIDLVSQPAHVFAALKERLVKRQSPYEAVFAALLALASAAPDLATVEKLMAEPDPEPDDLGALDAVWEEEEVLFGPGSAAEACGRDQLVAKVRQARRPAPGLEPRSAAGPKTIVSYSGRSVTATR
ncbi:MAG: nitrate reductase molybdenum cofactor assembly chaperone [Hyphomicrobiales bacterium]|nr:nitrate reductase molybdenum cofactor assembly chaperone [Hyphomicrobiales bacterium]